MFWCAFHRKIADAKSGGANILTGFSFQLRALVKPEQTQDDAQADALGDLFRVAFRAACDRLAVSKLEDGAPHKAKLH